MIQKSVQILKQLQHPNGLFSASPNEKTGYHLSWIRDNIYESLGFEAIGDYSAVQKTLRALLDVLLKHEYKIEHAIKEKPKHTHQYIHARYHPATMDEIWEEWGNKQNDAIGLLLFKMGDLEKKGIKIIRNENDIRIIQKLVNYLQSIEYWHDKDNGIWEEMEELHASSIGACVAGLRKIAGIVDVNPELITKGEIALKRILPRESETKGTDLALLSLIYPFNIVSDEDGDAILKAVEKKLVRDKGVIRYPGDSYHSNGSEAEWCMGLCWLAIIYKQFDAKKYSHYLKKAAKAMNEDGELPELYFAGTNEHNENSPLGWAQSLFIVASVK